MPYIDINRPRFLRLVYEASRTEHTRTNIGTYKEKTLHRVLKDYFESDRERQEVPVDRFVADIFSPEGIVEIQTSGLASMRDKLEAFLPLGHVTVVYPVAVKKWVSWIDPESGEIGKKRRSPKTGKLLDVVPEMIYILPYLLHENLTVRVVLLEIEEYRWLNGRRSLSGKRGSTRYERIPVDLLGIYDFASPRDYLSQLPTLPDAEFTAKELTAPLKLRGRRASAFVRVLMEVGVLGRCGKRGNAYLYRLAELSDK